MNRLRFSTPLNLPEAGGRVLGALEDPAAAGAAVGAHAQAAFNCARIASGPVRAGVDASGHSWAPQAWHITREASC
jgi:hypothetical protein